MPSNSNKQSSQERFAPTNRSSRHVVGPFGLGAVAASCTGVLCILVKEDIFAAALLLLAALLFTVESKRTDSPATAREAIRISAEVAFCVCLAFALGASTAQSEQFVESALLCWSAAFSIVVQQYVHTIFARTVKQAKIGEPLLLGIDPAKMPGTLRGISNHSALTWLRFDRAILPLAFAAYLIAERSQVVLWATAIVTFAGLLWTSLLRGWLIYRSERQSEAQSNRDMPPARSGLIGRERWRKLLEGFAGARDDAFWGLCFARPIVVILLYPTADFRWLTPNRVTFVSMLVCLAAGAIAIFGGESLLFCAILLILLRSVLDSFDGQLARYRGLSSQFGSFFDKASDAFCWAALYLSLGLAAYGELGSKVALLIPLAAVTVEQFRGITFWLAKELQTEVQKPNPKPLELPSFTAYLKNLWRIVLFEEPDFYLWISLALITKQFSLFLLLIGATHGARLVALSAKRIHMTLNYWRLHRSIAQ